MNIKLIINLTIYISFFATLLTGFIWGVKRGVRKSALRFSLLVLFIIIAGLISRPISNSLIKINISGLGIKIGGTTVNSIPHLIQLFTNSISGFNTITESIPSTVSFINQLPVALLNIVVFFLLVFIMQAISWIVYAFISRFALKETKMDRLLKKQRKEEKKLRKKEKTEKKVIETQPKALPLPQPKKYRLWGGAVGAVQSFVLLFLLFIPLTSLLGVFDKITYPDLSSTSVYAEEESEFLNELSRDLITTIMGEEVVSYIDTFNISFPAKALSLFGFNDVVFDSLSRINVNNEKIALRQELLTASKIYDNYVLILNEMGQNENLSDIDFKIVNTLFNSVFKSKIINAFGEEIIVYASTQIDSIEIEGFSSFTNLKDAIVLIVDIYQNEPIGFMPSLKKDLQHLLNFAEVSFKSGLVDNFFLQNIVIDNIVNDIKKEDYRVLKSLTQEGYSSHLLKVSTAYGLNILLDLGSSSLSNDLFEADLGFITYENVEWDDAKNSIYNILKTGLDIYDIISLYDINTFINSPESLLSDIADEDLSSLVSLIGTEVDLVKDSSLFDKNNSPIAGLINWIGHKDSLEPFISAEDMLEVNSWKNTFEQLSSSVIEIKNSSVLDMIIENNFDMNELVDFLLDNEKHSVSNFNYIFSPIINSPISNNLIITFLNKSNSLLEENLSSFSLSEFSRETFNFDEKGDILDVFENVLNCFSILSSGDDLNIENIDVDKIAALLTSLQDNAFRKNTSNPTPYNVDFENKTIIGGGIFSNYYISLVSYLFGDLTNINYKTINWHTFLNSSQDLFSNFENFGDISSIEDLLDLASEDNQENLENLLDAIGLDSSIIQSLIDINSALNSFDGEDEIEESLYDAIENSLNDIINSENEEGSNTIESLVEIIESITGEDFSENINLSMIEREKIVNARLKLLHPSYEIDAVDLNFDSIHPTLNLLDATIQDLSCGTTYVLQNFYNSGKRISVSNINQSDLYNKIENSTEDTTLINLLKDLFVIN